MTDAAALILDRVKTRVTALRGRVRGAADFAAQIAGDKIPARRPCAFVLLVGEDAATPETGSMVFRQRVASTVGVILLDDRAGDGGGARAAAGLQPLVAAVRAAVAGWVPDGLPWPVEFRRARLVDVRAGIVFWQVDFRLSWHLTA